MVFLYFIGLYRILLDQYGWQLEHCLDRHHLMIYPIAMRIDTNTILPLYGRFQITNQSSCGGRFPIAQFVLLCSSGSPDQGGYDTENIMLRCGNRELLGIYPCHHGADWNAQRRLCHPETHSSGMGWF